jgi:Fe2+ or Zn2+ uptake regulation protein
MEHTHSPNELRSQGYRLTPQRLVILNVLEEDGGHLSPQEIFNRAEKRLPGLTEATVYRTLDFLVEHDLALVAHVGSGRMLFENAHRQHHHLICRECGQELAIDDTALQDLYANIKSTTGFEIDTSHVVFFGHCKECRER